MRALQLYAPKADAPRSTAAIARAAAWLADRQRRSHRRARVSAARAFVGGRRPDAIQKAAAALVAEQRPDGGWSQLPSLDSDAYATGQALWRWPKAARSRHDPAYKRGVQFLLNTQFADGSWFVKSRAIPLQPHFESGFPFGRDQFISAAGTNWAAGALALARTPKPS